MDEMGDDGQKLQTSSCTGNASWGRNAQYGVKLIILCCVFESC